MPTLATAPGGERTFYFHFLVIRFQSLIQALPPSLLFTEEQENQNVLLCEIFISSVKSGEITDENKET